MARNPVQGPSYLDPLFPIPDGLVDYQHSDVLDPSVSEFMADESDSSLLENSSDIEDDSYVVDDDDDEPDEIDVPNMLTVVDQIIRTQPSGMQVVDLIVEVEDVAGAANYEFRVVKM
jgi:hypothetical protein